MITGADSGIGFETARVLARHGATVVMACRDMARAEQAADRLRANDPGIDLHLQSLDLARLTSIAAAASAIRAAHPRLDVLVNNAGVMRPPTPHTSDGFNATFGINYLGHFALTGLLLDRLLATPGSRIISVSSLAHLAGRLRTRDLTRICGRTGPAHRPPRPYPNSKLAALMFSHELARRLTAAGASTAAVAAHPGIARTALVRDCPSFIRAFVTGPLTPAMNWLIQDQQAGALAPLRAALDPTARAGEFYGPDGLFGGTGQPAPARSSRAARNRARQRLLWAESERLTGVTYPLPAAG